MHLPAAQRRPELDDAHDLRRSGVGLGMTHPNGHDEGFPGGDDAVLTVEREMGFAGRDDEALLLVQVDMLGDRPARLATPVEAEYPLAVPRDRDELDPLAGGRIGNGSEPGAVAVAQAVCGVNRGA